MTRQEPQGHRDGEAQLFAAYLDFYRETCIEKVAGLPPGARTGSRLPTGWSPGELLFHLACMERRWFVWGWLGEPVDRPWEDSGDDAEGPWKVPEGMTLDEMVARLRGVGDRTRALLARDPLDGLAPPGARFGDEEPASLRWICFHVLQEFARHAGHLDIAVELAGGPVGE